MERDINLKKRKTVYIPADIDRLVRKALPDSDKDKDFSALVTGLLAEWITSGDKKTHNGEADQSENTGSRSIELSESDLEWIRSEQSRLRQVTGIEPTHSELIHMLIIEYADGALLPRIGVEKEKINTDMLQNRDTSNPTNENDGWLFILRQLLESGHEAATVAIKTNLRAFYELLFRARRESAERESHDFENVWNEFWRTAGTIESISGRNLLDEKGPEDGGGDSRERGSKRGRGKQSVG